MSWRNRPALIALSILIAVLTMGLWLHSFKVTPAELALVGQRLRSWPILPLFALLAGHVALAAWRWSLIEVGLGGDRPRFGPAFAAGAFALALGTFLPAPMINVACRGIANRISGTSALRGALSGGIDQIADLAVVLLFAVPALFAFLHNDLQMFLAGAAGMAVIGLGLLGALPPLARWVAGRWPRLVPAEAMALFRPALLVRIYGLSLLRVANITLMTLAIHAATGAASVAAVMIGSPLVTLAISAAMLPGAFGISEWSFSAVYARLGVPNTEIVLFVLTNRILLTALSLALGLIVLLAVLPRLLRRARAG